MTPEVSAKRLQLLKEVVPRVARIAVLWDPNNPFHAKVVQDLKAAAPSLSIEIKVIGAGTPEEIDLAFSAANLANAQALLVIEDPFFDIHRMTLVELASKARLPAIYGVRRFVDAGGLMSYSTSFRDLMRRSAGYVDKILKGAKPGDLPIEQPTKFELVVNLKTAQALGLTIPPSILARADEVIE
jgi:putative ABC transport system substrate-binding protein